MPLTLAEQILARASGKTAVSPGDIVEARVDVVMLHDVGAVGIQQPLKELGLPAIAPGVECVIVPDHFAPAPTVQAAENLKTTREFAHRCPQATYYELGRGGICHQVMVEKGHVKPWQVIVAPDAHATMYGACGAFGTGLGVTDVAIALATGSLWFRVPQTVRIVLRGQPGTLVSAKDISLFLLGKFGDTRLIYRSLEPVGPVMDRMSMDGRFCLADMAYEMGAKVCLLPTDAACMAYLRSVTSGDLEALAAEPGAPVEETHVFDLTNLQPMVAAPHSPANVLPVSDVEGVRIDQAFLGSCTNGRREDLQVAAGILDGKSVHPDVRLIVTPASVEVYRWALGNGIIETFTEAGAVVTNPTCGVCVGGHLGLLAAGEVCIASSNRNFRGRMGSPDAEIYLASPATVAASALAGRIVNPIRYAERLS